MTNATAPKDSWASILFEKLRIEYDIELFQSSCLYADCVKPYEEMRGKQKMTTQSSYYFVILLIQLQCPKQHFDQNLNPTKSFLPKDVKMTTCHEIRISHFPALYENWKNQFDNYDIWKKPDFLTKWVSLLTIGPFTTYTNAQIFEAGWTNIARGLTTKIVKIQCLVNEYNQQTTKAVIQGRGRGLSVSAPHVKIYITPLKREEHFTKTAKFLYTPETVFEGDQKEPNSGLDPMVNWTMDLESGSIRSESKELNRLYDLLH